MYPKLSGALYSYLGHFRKPKFVKEGHNTNSWESMPEPLKTQVWAKAKTGGKPRGRVRNDDVEAELQGIRRPDAKRMRDLDLNPDDIRGYKRWREENPGGTFKEYDRLMRNR